MKNFGLAFLRGLAYALAFLVVFMFFDLPLDWVMSRTFSAAPAQSSQDDRVSKYWKDYEVQKKRQDEALERAEHYYDRMEANAAKQEEINRRLEAVIARWEKDSPPAKQ